MSLRYVGSLKFENEKGIGLSVGIAIETCSGTCCIDIVKVWSRSGTRAEFFDEVEVDSRVSYAEEPVQIVDCKEQVLTGKIISVS